MSLSISLSKRMHFFVKDGKLAVVLHKQSKHSDKDFAVRNDVPIEKIRELHRWAGDIIARHDVSKK